MARIFSTTRAHEHTHVLVASDTPLSLSLSLSQSKADLSIVRLDVFVRMSAHMCTCAYMYDGVVLFSITLCFVYIYISFNECSVTLNTQKQFNVTSSYIHIEKADVQKD